MREVFLSLILVPLFAVTVAAQASPFSSQRLALESTLIVQKPSYRVKQVRSCFLTIKVDSYLLRKSSKMTRQAQTVRNPGLRGPQTASLTRHFAQKLLRRKILGYKDQGLLM